MFHLPSLIQHHDCRPIPSLPLAGWYSPEIQVDANGDITPEQINEEAKGWLLFVGQLSRKDWCVCCEVN
jgi:hypothetical protein